MSALDTMTRRQSRVTFAPCSAPGFRPRARRWLFGLVAASIAAAGCSAPQTPSSVEEARAEVPGPQPIPAPPVARPTPEKQEPSGASPAGALRSRSIGRHVMAYSPALAFDRTDFNTEQYDFIAYACVLEIAEIQEDVLERNAGHAHPTTRE